MLQSIINVYLNINSLDEILNINKDNLTEIEKILYDKIWNFEISTNEVLPDILRILNEKIGLNFRIEHNQKKYVKEEIDVAPALALDGGAQTFTTYRYNIVDSIVFADEINNIKMIFAENYITKKFEKECLLINKNLYETISINAISLLNSNSILKDILFKIIEKALNKNELIIFDYFTNIVKQRTYNLQNLLSDTQKQVINIEQTIQKNQQNIANLNYSQVDYTNFTEKLKNIDDKLHEIYSYPNSSRIIKQILNIVRFRREDILTTMTFGEYDSVAIAVIYENNQYNIKEVDDEVKTHLTNAKGAYIRVESFLNDYPFFFEDYFYIFLQFPEEILNLANLIQEIQDKIFIPLEEMNVIKYDNADKSKLANFYEIIYNFFQENNNYWQEKSLIIEKYVKIIKIPSDDLSDFDHYDDRWKEIGKKIWQAKADDKLKRKLNTNAKYIHFNSRVCKEDNLYFLYDLVDYSQRLIRIIGDNLFNYLNEYLVRYQKETELEELKSQLLFKQKEWERLNKLLNDDYNLLKIKQDDIITLQTELSYLNNKTNQMGELQSKKESKLVRKKL